MGAHDLSQYLWPDIAQGRQPQHVLSIDWTNAITAGLAYAFVNGVEVVSGAASGFSQIGFSSVGQTERGATGVYSAIHDVVACTVIGHHKYTSDNLDYAGLVHGYYSSSADCRQLGIGMGTFSVAQIYCVNRANGGGVTTIETAAFPYEAVWAITGLLDGSSSALAYKNGAYFASISKSGTAAFAQDPRVAEQKFVTSSVGKESSWHYKFDRILSAPEIASLSANPWQIFSPPTTFPLRGASALYPTLSNARFNPATSTGGYPAIDLS